MRYYRSLVYMPKNIPALRDMLADIGNPTPKEVAKALKVTERSVWRWLREGKAPHSAMLAIYWLTTWGISEIDAAAHNAAIYSAGRARCLQEELEAIQAQLARLSQIGDFGSSNDPARGAVSNPRLQVQAKTGNMADRKPMEKPDKPPVESDQPPAVEPSIHAGFRGYGS